MKTYEELEKENAELKRQLEEWQIFDNFIRINQIALRKVIVVFGTQGDGTRDNPYKNISLYYTVDGKFIGKDTYENEY